MRPLQPKTTQTCLEIRVPFVRKLSNILGRVNFLRLQESGNFLKF